MFVSHSLHTELLKHRATLETLSLRELFEGDPERPSKFLRQASGLSIDFSKSLVTEDILQTLFEITSECNLVDKIEDMFTGQKINVTENRAALHTALRASIDTKVEVNGENVVPDVHNVLSKMKQITNDLTSGTWRGATGKTISSVVNIGIGGSDLGPSMAVNALTTFRASNIKQYFVSNVDPNEIALVLEQCNPETTLFIVASKTFTTTETLLNASIARQWLKSFLPEEVELTQHFIALSTNVESAVAFGVKAENVLGFWDWVGGRFSLPSAIGLSVMIRIGVDNFLEFLSGMRDMDTYFRNTIVEENAVVIYSLIGIWYRNYLHYSSYAVLPYDTLLSRLPAYLQQLIMESNGKRVNIHGDEIDYGTSFVVWGEPGTNGQHSFHQLLHQGTDIVPVDFLVAAVSTTKYQESHDNLIANAIAQSHVLAFGSDGDLPPYKHMPGNRPSITFLYENLNPYVLGQIIAFYEHVVFTQGVIWNINSFDQWGVELGKKEASSTLASIRDTMQADPNEKSIILKIQSLRNEK